MSDKTPAPDVPLHMTTEQLQAVVTMTVKTVVDQFRDEVRAIVDELRKERTVEIQRLDGVVKRHEQQLRETIASAAASAASVDELQATMEQDAKERGKAFNELMNTIQGWRGEFTGWTTARDEAHDEHRENARRLDREVDAVENRVNGTEQTIGLMSKDLTALFNRTTANTNNITDLAKQVKALAAMVEKTTTEQAAVLAKLAQPSAPVRLVKMALAYAADNPKRVIGAAAVIVPSIVAIIDALSKVIR